MIQRRIAECITHRCVHHKGGTCRVEKVDASIGNVNGYRSVYSFGEAGGSYCWHPGRRAEEGRLL